MQSIFKRVINIINNTTIAKKTALLFFIMILGVLTMGSFAHMSISHIKNSFVQNIDKIDVIYDDVFTWIVVATLVTAAIVAFFALIILKNIRFLDELMKEEIRLKTEELELLNSALKKKISFEVEQNRKKDQIMFRQSRLASMGEMIGNIAHQWRQPLSVMMLIVQSFKMKKEAGKLSDEFIEMQVKEGIKVANSMSKTIDDFRDFFKPNREKESFSAKKVIDESVNMIWKYYEGLNINTMLTCSDDFKTTGYPNELLQVIMNLLSNSKDALNKNDIIKKHIEVSISIDKKAKKGKISVIDNGGGICSEVIEKMFEPYFTTKHKSNGTGIGLYMSKQIIEKQMFGVIEAKNISYKFSNDEKMYKQCACVDIMMPIE